MQLGRNDGCCAQSKCVRIAQSMLSARPSTDVATTSEGCRRQRAEHPSNTLHIRQFART
jgi:hypothetical protein